MKTNLFDMEQQVMTCWSVCEDLGTLYEGVLDQDMDQDKIANCLLGMKELYQLKFEKLWDHFEQVTREIYQLRKEVESQRPD